MWFPETTFDWVIVGYIVVGLLYVAHGYQQLNSASGREAAEKHAGPMPPELFRILYPVVTVMLVVAAFAVWPLAWGWEAFDYVKWKSGRKK